jgi:hypothetical protein
MPEVDEKVMSFVEGVLKKKPGIELEELFEATKKFKPSIGSLSRRQFNARYPLQVKRRRALAERGVKGRGKRPKTKKTPTAVSQKRPRPLPSSEAHPKDAIRQIFLQFATDIAAAEERKDLVKVLASVDKYVDEVFRSIPRG